MTKKELEEENKSLKSVIDFYFDYGCRKMTTDELIEKIRKQKNLSKLIEKLFLLLAILFLCGAFYLLGLAS